LTKKPRIALKFTFGVGIDAGAEKYFGKSASQLKLEETAALVGMIRSPRIYSPVAHPDRAAQRRNSILDGMAVQGIVTQIEADRAKDIPIRMLQSLSRTPLAGFLSEIADFDNHLRSE
jgi:membrane peptidoglycan carboxypeptidase